jgi:hypothetical protein
MSLKGRKVFVRKNGTQQGGRLYKWSPTNTDKKINKKQISAYFCVAPLGGQGNDFISTYSYVVVLVSGQANRLAYVQCDYVK